MSNILLSMLLIWHLTSAIVWLGSSVAFVLVFSPSLRSIDEVEFTQIIGTFVKRLIRVLGAASISTIFAGIFLFSYVISVAPPIMPTGWRWIFLALGAILGLVGTIITFGVLLPLGLRFLQLSKNPASNMQSERSPGAVMTQSTLRTNFATIYTVALTVTVILGIILLLMILGVFV